MQCPDCPGVTGDGQPGHIDTCPVCRQMDAAGMVDIQFFAKYPRATQYRRRLMPGDINVTSLDHIHTDDLVLVEQLEPGVFYRYLPAYRVTPNADGEFTPDALRAAELSQYRERQVDVRWLLQQQAKA